MKEPVTEKWILEGGAQCISALVPNAPLLCLDIWCKAGSINEKKGEEGLAHFLEHMLFKGSGKLAKGDFDLKIESIGGSSNAATGYDDVHYYVLIPPDKIDQGIDLLAQLVLNPLFDKKEFDLEREVVLEEIAQQNDQPDETIFQSLLEECWSNQPYGRPILGSEYSLKGTSCDSMKSFHERLYLARNIVLSIAGNVPTNIKDIVQNSEFGALTKNITKNIDTINQSDHIFYTGYKELKVERLESSRIIIGWELPPTKDEFNSIGADIISSLLAEGRKSLLVNTLVEKLRLVNNIDVDVTTLEKGGVLILEALCEEKNIIKVEQHIHALISDIGKNGISKEDFNRAKKLVLNSHCFYQETPRQIAGLKGNQHLWGRSTSLSKEKEIADKWTPNKLKDRIINNFIPENSFTIIATQK